MQRNLTGVLAVMLVLGLSLALPGTAWSRHKPKPTSGATQGGTQDGTQNGSQTVSPNGALAQMFPPLQGSVQLIQTPNPQGHPEFIEAIKNAQTSVEMVMYHLTDKEVVKALADAVARGKKVRVLVDRASTKSPGYAAAYQELLADKIDARLSSSGFNITHEKSLIVDGTTAFVTAINLTRSSIDSRDLGIIVNDPSVISEMETVFESDWQNYDSGSNATPALSDANLAWSPVSSKSKLSQLIEGATSSLILTTENLADDQIVGLLQQAAGRGVIVQVIVPQCDLNPNSAFNIPAVRQLITGGVQARVMPAPSSPELPYMHSKMMVIDGQTIYVGSINLSYNSLTLSRELGIIFTDEAIAAQIGGIFSSDWQKAILAPAVNANCPTIN